MKPFDLKYYFRDDVNLNERTFDLFLIRANDREVIRDKQMAYTPSPMPENMSVERARVATIMLQHEIFKRVLSADYVGIGHIIDAYVAYCMNLVDPNVQRFYATINRDHEGKELAERADYWLQYALARDYSKPQHSSYRLMSIEVEGVWWEITAGLSAANPFSGECVIIANAKAQPHITENALKMRHLNTELTFSHDQFWMLDKETIAVAIEDARK